MNHGKALIIATKEFAKEDRTKSWYYTLSTLVILITCLAVTLQPVHLLVKLPFSILSGLVIVRIFVIYQPFSFFGTIGLILFGSGFLIGLRFLWLYFNGEGEGNIQSLILAGILLGMGFQTLLIAFVADLLAANRGLLEDIRFRTFKISRDKEIE